MMPSFRLNRRTFDVLDRLPDRSGPRVTRMWFRDGYTVAYSRLSSRLRIYKDANRLFTVSREYGCTDKSIYIDIVTPEQELAEKWLIMKAGVNHRWLCRMPPLLVPTRAHELKTGYTLVDRGDGGHELHRPDGTIVAATIFTHGFAALNSVEFSYGADAPLDLLVDSYLDLHGKPLLEGFVHGRFT